MNFVGHNPRANGRDRDLLTGAVYELRGGGRPQTRYSEHIKVLCGSIQTAVHLANNRAELRDLIPRRPRRLVLEPSVYDNDDPVLF